MIDPTVNEVGTFILRKVCSVEKWVAPQNEIKKRQGGCTKIIAHLQASVPSILGLIEI